MFRWQVHQWWQGPGQVQGCQEDGQERVGGGQGRLA